MIDALTEYGNAYGMVFQIVDDILDITATDEQLGKPAGHDMVEGVYTLPVLRTLALGTAACRGVGRVCSGRPLDAAAQDAGARDRALERRARLGGRHGTRRSSSGPRRAATTSPTPTPPQPCAPRPAALLESVSVTRLSAPARPVSLAHGR